MSDQSLCQIEQCNQEGQDGNVSRQQSEAASLTFRPQVDLIDSGDAITLWADLPGVDENTLDISVEHNTLTIKASVPQADFSGMKPLWNEYAVGNFERSFTLSEEIDREGIEAVVVQGVLKLTLPKTKHAAMWKVNVKGR